MLAGEAALEREPEDEGLEPSEGERLETPYGLGEVDRVEAGEVGLEERPEAEDRYPEALDSGSVTS